MPLTRNKKLRMFSDCDGKCEYCGVDMVLCFNNKFNYENEATFDHLYNKDHELRQTASGEKRIFLVCRKCNREKSKVEINNQLPKGVEKTVKKVVPKELWSDQKFMDKISEVINEERELASKIALLGKQLNRLRHEQKVLDCKMSKKINYRKLIIKHFADNYPAKAMGIEF